MDEIKEENRSELVDILDSYFDPEKEPITPAKTNTRRRSFKGSKGSPRENRRRSRNGNNDKTDKKHSAENNNNNESVSSPESSTRSPRRQRRSRRRNSTKSMDKSINESATEIGTTEIPSPIKITVTAPEITVAWAKPQVFQSHHIWNEILNQI